MDSEPCSKQFYLNFLHIIGNEWNTNIPFRASFRTFVNYSVKKIEKRGQKLHYFGQFVSFRSRLYLFSASVPNLVHHVSGLVEQQGFVLPGDVEI